MKKYLVKGALALFGGAFLFSCAEKEADYVPIVEQKVKAYEDVFKEVYGDIDPYQNWGFTNKVVLADESTSEVVYVDSIMSEPYESIARARTRVENANANEWADPNKAYGGLMVPPPLTPEQKAVVIKYFQITPNLGYEDPKWTNYFIQQVYKGHTSPMAGKSPEAYLAANGSTYLYASDYMDHLAAINGTFVDHINNFNHGDCSENSSVLDNGSYVNGGTYHSDKIMYMKESTTKSFGYYNSNGSVRRTEYTGLVSYKTIMKALGSEADCLEDGWNRSFMGFDFEQMVGPEIYAKELDYSAGWSADIPGGFPVKDYIWFEWKGQKYHMLVAEQNMYCGTPLEISDAQVQENGFIDNLLSQGYLPVTGGASKKWVKVGGCADGYFSDWIVTLTEAKGRTSEPDEDPHIEEKSILVETQSGRIFCEDLGVSTREDLDFNDVVFDVYVWMNYKEGYIDHYIKYSDGTKELTSHEEYSTKDQATYTCRIVLQAAGGTIPVTVAGQDVHSAFREGNAPVSHTTMINTYDNNTTAFGDFAECASVDLGVLLGKPNGLFTPTTLFPNSSKYTSDQVCIEALDIPIVVKYGTGTNGVGELGNSLGGAPAKIFVPNYDTRWTVERKPLSLAYPNFTSYVSNKDVQWWDDSDLSPAAVQSASYYRHGNTIGGSTAKPPIVITRFIYPASTEKDLWRGSWPTDPDDEGKWWLNNFKLNLGAFYGANKDRKEKPFYPGDRIRFYASDLKDDSYITVVYADGSMPYFIDAPFPNFKVDNKGGLILDEEGNKIPVTSGVIEVVLDEENAEKMNSTVQTYSTIQVQGRNFTLKSIGIVPFK